MFLCMLLLLTGPSRRSRPPGPRARPGPPRARRSWSPGAIIAIIHIITICVCIYIYIYIYTYNRYNSETRGRAYLREAKLSLSYLYIGIRETRTRGSETNNSYLGQGVHTCCLKQKGISSWGQGVAHIFYLLNLNVIR